MSPVGISFPAHIPDSQMTASSQRNKVTEPFYGRLHDYRGNGWCAKEAKRNDDWLQVDFSKTVHVCAVATQGDAKGKKWITDFKLSYSADGKKWTTYKDAKGAEVVRLISVVTCKTRGESSGRGLGGLVSHPLLWGRLSMKLRKGTKLSLRQLCFRLFCYRSIRSAIPPPPPFQNLGSATEDVGLL